MAEPDSLILRQLQTLSDQLARTNQKLDDPAARQMMLEQEMQAPKRHRLWHETQFAEVQDMIDRIQRRLEITDGRD